MALVTTFATTPLTVALYPPWYQKKLAAWKRGEIDWDTGAPISGSDSTQDSLAFEKLESNKVQRLLVYLRMDNMPAILTFMSLFGTQQKITQKTHHLLGGSTENENAESTPSNEQVKNPVRAHGVRLLELTDRESSVMKVSELDEYTENDPVVNTFRTFGALHSVAVSGEVTVLPESSFADTLINKASETSSDLVLLPWSETGSMSESPVITKDSTNSKISGPYISFVQNALETSSCSVAVFINKNFGIHVTDKRPKLSRTFSKVSLRSAHDNPIAPIKDLSHHIFLPFFGGADDRAALRFVLQLAENADVTATIVHFEAPADYFEPTDLSRVNTNVSPTGAGKTADVSATTTVPPAERDSVFFSSLKSSLPATLASRVVFETVSTQTPVAAALERGAEELGRNPKNAGNLMIVGRNDGLRSSFAKEKSSGYAAEDAARPTAKCLGVVGDRALKSKVAGSVVVFQARG